MITTAAALEALKSLSPAAIFLQSYETRNLPHRLEIYFGPPEEFFLSPDSLVDSYTEGRLIPILDDGNFGNVTFYDPRNNSLIVKDVECPDEPVARFSNWQQYLAELLIRVGETVEEDARLRAISDAVGFKYFDRLMAFLSGSGDQNHRPYQERKKKLIESIAKENE